MAIHFSEDSPICMLARGVYVRSRDEMDSRTFPPRVRVQMGESSLQVLICEYKSQIS